MDSTSPSNGSRVLVIDDEPEIMDLIRLILERERGDEVICVVGGRKGIAMAQDVLPDLIILDIMMPDLDGWETFTRIKAISTLQPTPILFIAAANALYIYPMAKQIGAAGYLQEPFGPSDLVTAHDAVLRGEPYYPPIPEGVALSEQRGSLLQRIIGLFGRRG